MSTRQKGFTVVELLLVLLFIGLLAAMAVNISMQSRNRWALRNTAREITSIFYQAKQLASRESEAVMIDFTADEYVLNLWRSGAWERYKSGKYGEKVTVSKTPTDSTGFAISPSGFILNPDTKVIWGMQTIVLQAPHPRGMDSMTINIYPYGGVRVQKDFK
jgi:prepilin-type N-terminal cleavage/methylation domain-containing protein